MAKYLVDKSIEECRIRYRGDFLEISLDKAIEIIQSANNKVNNVFSKKRQHLEYEEILIRIFRCIDDIVCQNELLTIAANICVDRCSSKLLEDSKNTFSEKLHSGYIYIMKNPGFIKHLHKIGFSINPHRRAKELHTTGVPFEYKVIFQKWVLDLRIAESLSHKYLKDFRVNDSREFFLVSPELAKRIVECAIDETNKIYSEEKIMFKELILLQLFQKMDSYEKSELLQTATEIFSRNHSLDSHYYAYANKEELIANLKNYSLDDKLSSTRPFIEPSMYLDEYIHQVLEYAWSEGISDVVLGTSEYDIEYAQYLLDEVEEVAIREHFPVEPYFSIEDMLKFIRRWRINLIDVVERKIPLPYQTKNLWYFIFRYRSQ